MEQEFRANYRAHQDFKESAIWQDYKQEVLNWVTDIQGVLEETIVTEEIFRCQGRIEACRRFLTLPDYIAAGFEQRAKEGEEQDGTAGI